MARFVGYVPVHKFVLSLLSLLSLVLVLDIMVTGSVARILTFLNKESISIKKPKTKIGKC